MTKESIPTSLTFVNANLTMYNCWQESKQNKPNPTNNQKLQGSFGNRHSEMIPIQVILNTTFWQDVTRKVNLFQKQKH